MKDDHLNLFNGYLVNEEYPPALFTAGVITLIPKVGDEYDLQNKRPISMLNTDYKLFTKILWNRIQPMMKNVLGAEQAACVEDNSCITNLRLLRNILVKANKSKKFKGAILSLDLEKAFDRVDHDFLWKVLKKIDFPDEFINCLKKLYKNATSTVLFNGFLTEPFQILSSVRQGCPLSMALFAFYIEPLIRMIDQNINGVLIDNRFLKVVAYADDINIFVKNDSEFDIILQLVHYYSLYSKIKLNLFKSQFLRFNSCMIGPQQIKEVDDLKILGVHFSQSFDKTIDQNYNGIIKLINISLLQQYSRRLNLFQKVYVLNTYILSKLWYVAQVFPPDNKHLASLRSICGKFLWKGHFYKVERNELYLPVLKGGIALLDVECKTKSLFIKNILFGKSDELDTFMINQLVNKNLTRNTREWLQEADVLKNENQLNTSKKLYDYFIESKKIEIKKQKENPHLQWNTLFENTNKNFLSTTAKSYLFMASRDIIPCNSKLFRHGVKGAESPFCVLCGAQDTVEHRFKDCVHSKIIWTWLNNIVINKLKLKVKDAEEVLWCDFNDQNVKLKAALWLTVESLAYCLQTFGEGTLDELKSRLCESRWNSREIFKKHFKHFLNVF